MASIPLYKTQTVPEAPAAALGSGAVKLMKVVIGGHTANTTVVFKNAATDTGTILLTVSALANQTKECDLTDVGGIYFSTGCFCKPTGTAAVAYAWYE